MSEQNQPLVYFIGKSNFGDDEPDFIKIGRTTDLSRRVRNIQTSCESEISVIGVIPFDTKEEASSKETDIHLLFRAFCSYREWFYATPRIIEYIEKYAVQYTELFTIGTPSTSDEEVVEFDEPPIQDEETVEFGNWLKERREERGLTQAEVSEAIDCSRGFIAIIEQGRGMPGKEIYDKLIGLFGDPSDSTVETKFNNPLGVMLEGNFISENTGIDTFIEVIKTIGIDEVKELDLYVNGIPLIADRDYEGKALRKVETEEIGTCWIVSGINTVRKKDILDDIAARLNIDITVFANPRA